MFSKSQYLVGLECSKALWLTRNRRDLIEKENMSAEYRFTIGNEVGEIAKQYYGEGFEPKTEYYEVEKANKLTLESIKEGTEIIYEGTGIHSHSKVFARADILFLNSDKSWELLEVKSSTSAKDYHIDDLSFQYHVFSENGLNIKNISVLHLNKSYKYKKKLNISSLLIKTDVTEVVLEKQKGIEERIENLVSVCHNKNEPIVALGSHCKNCSYKEYCWKEIPKYNIFSVFTGKKAEKIFLQNKSMAVEDLAKDDYPNGNKKIDLISYLNKETFIDRKKISTFFNSLSYPLFFLDFETFSPAIPIFENTKPYEPIPFQFSLHIERNIGSELEHHEYLHKTRDDPRVMFTKKLLNVCEQVGTIIVYNQSFEMNIIKLLAKNFPENSASLLDLNKRMVDLLIPFRSRWVYSPDQNSSASIKRVLPAFTGKNYKDLDIQGGMEASIKYEDFFKGDLSGKELNDYWIGVLGYCHLDTEAMVLLLEKLRSYIES